VIKLGGQKAQEDSSSATGTQKVMTRIRFSAPVDVLFLSVSEVDPKAMTGP
jgi:hypothetical protein